MLKRILTFGMTTLSCLIVAPAYSLTLDDTIAATIERNPDILTLEKDHYAITEALNQAKAPFLPQVKLNLGYGPDKNVNSNTIATNNTAPTMPRREEGVTLNQMIFDGFATKNDVARNKARVNSAVYKVLASVQDNVQRNVEVYLGVLKEKELVELAQENLDFHEKIYRMISLRTERGVSREADHFQAEARLSLAKANLLAELSNLSDAKANFYRTTGLAPEALVPPPSPDPRYVPKTLQQALDVAMKNNPVVKSASADIMAAIEQHNVALAVNYPRLDLELGLSRDRNIGGVRGPSYDQYAVIRMTYDLFNGGADISRQRETVYQEQEAREIKQHSIRQLIETVKLTWDLYITARGQIPELAMHVKSSGKTVRAYAEQYQIGQRTLLDLLDGQNELFGAKRALINGRYDVLQSEYRILRDMGISVVALHLENDLTEHAYADAAHDVDLGPEPTGYDKSHYGVSIVEAKRQGYSSAVYDVKDKSTVSVEGIGLQPKSVPEYKPVNVLPIPVKKNKPQKPAAPLAQTNPNSALPVTPIAGENSKPIFPATPIKESLSTKIAPPLTKTESKSSMAVAAEAPVPVRPVGAMTQVGCFKSKQNAEHLVEKLRAENYIVTTKEIPSAHGVLIHVYQSEPQLAVNSLAKRPAPNAAPKVDTHDELLVELIKKNKLAKPAAPQVTAAKPTGWLIQVGCFKSKEKVKLLVDKLRGANFSVTFKEVKSAHGVLTHVYVGQQMALSSARLLANQLKQRVQLEGFPVQAV